MSGILMDLCLPTVDTVVHNSCVFLLNYALYPVITFYCGLILLGEYVRFLASFSCLLCIVLSDFIFYGLLSEINLDDDDDDDDDKLLCYESVFGPPVITGRKRDLTPVDARQVICIHRMSDVSLSYT